MDNLRGKLYIVATPIGNTDDITIRAIKILGNVDIIAAEDTRIAARLLSHHNIRGKIVSCHEHNEKEKTPFFMEKLEKGQSVALISDAGTPIVSDPGYRLVKHAIKNGINVIPIPGPCAAISALSVSGLPTDSFIFLGFVPKKKAKRHEFLLSLKDDPRTIIFYESPLRIIKLIEDIIFIMGDRQGFLSREMTKPHEEFIRGLLSQILERLKSKQKIKGECTLIIGRPVINSLPDMEKIRDEIKRQLARGDYKISHISKKIAKKYGLSKKDIYSEAVAIKNML